MMVTSKMKQVEKAIRYHLMSGEEKVAEGHNIKDLVRAVGCSYDHLYSGKYKNINGDGSWSFNFQGYNYTIIKLS